jgi:hypothetical protein
MKTKIMIATTLFQIVTSCTPVQIKELGDVNNDSIPDYMITEKDSCYTLMSYRAVKELNDTVYVKFIKNSKTVSFNGRLYEKSSLKHDTIYRGEIHESPTQDK